MKLTNFSLIFILAFFFSISYAQTPSHLLIDNFNSGNLNQWENKSFSGTTDYQITSLDNTLVLRAISNSSASVLFRQQKIDLLITPFLNWRWRVENSLGEINEKSKDGDDYSARVYVVIDGGWSFWKTKVINYVWSSNSNKNSQWPNAFAGNNAMMLAIRSANDKRATWYQEKRNIIEDFKALYGIDIRYIDVIALMTDTDNTSSHATSYYDNIFFSSQ